MELGGEYAAMWNIQVQEREKMIEMETVSQQTSFLLSACAPVFQ